MSVTYDFSGLQKAIRQKVSLSKTPIPDIVQDVALKLLVGSGTGPGLVQLTRKATAERIKADMNVPVSGRLGKGTGSGRMITRPRLFWLALGWLKARGIPASKADVKETMMLILRFRIASRAYIAAGFLWCARNLYEGSAYLKKKHKFTRLREKDMPMVDKEAGGSAANSFATPVIINGNTARIVLTNTSRGGGTVGLENLQQAINNAETDVMEYVDKKVAVGLVKEMFKGVNCKISAA
jgi:hypothetical protein